MNQAPERDAAAPVLLEDTRDGVTTLTLNRPERFNALSDELLGALAESLRRLAGAPRTRVVVIAGAGKAFCAGHDLGQMWQQRGDDYFDDLFERCSAVMQQIVALPQPVVARVHGVATAAGCQLVAACDLAVASNAARFAVSGVRLGLFCSTPAVALSRNLGRKKAFEMLVTGEFIDAESARTEGLVNRVTAPEDLDAEVARLCAAIAQKPAAAIALGKQGFYRQLERGLAEAYAIAGRTMTCNLREPEAQEGIEAFLEKRPPRWPRG